MSGIIDLEELALRCENLTAQEFIREAIAAYNAGAYRGAIIMTWIAVVFDIIEKLQILKSVGDPAAAKLLQDFQNAIQGANTLNFERTLISRIKKDLDMITELQENDLNRLREDRNACSHPSMIQINEPFRPTAELARMHIRHAVEHLLAEPPVQGTFAYSWLEKQIDSAYFPEEVEAAVTYFKAGPLRKARKSLVRKLLNALLKAVILGKAEEKQRNQQLAAIGGILSLYSALSLEVTREILSAIIIGCEEDRALIRVLRLLSCTPQLQTTLQDDAIIKLRHFVSHQENIFEEDGIRVFWALSIDVLRPTALERLANLSLGEIGITIRKFGLPSASEMFNFGIKLFCASNSLGEGYSFTDRILIPYADSLDQGQKEAIFAAVAAEAPLYKIYNRESLISALSGSTTDASSS